MLIPHGTHVAVADGAQFSLFRNTGGEGSLALSPVEAPTPEGDNRDAGKRLHSSDANPEERQMEEASFAAATADWLNHQVLTNQIDQLIVIAAPRTLGELRKHYHKMLTQKLVAEIAKDLTGHLIADIENALNGAKAA